ncbi:MAG: hypothetical protein MHM6MM_002373 [Cercozoa sp. M6MM]
MQRFVFRTSRSVRTLAVGKVHYEGKIIDAPESAWEFDERTYPRSMEDNELPEQATRKRLLYRSQMRGLKELDIVIGRWVENNIDSLNRDELRQLDAIMREESQDMLHVVLRQGPVPERIQGSVIDAILAFADKGNVCNVE